MSIDEVRRFATDLRSNAGLRADAEKDQAGKSHGTPLARCVAFAGAKGYSFTVDDLKQSTSPAGKPLSEGELDNIAGGNLMGLWKLPVLMPLGVLLGIKPF